jgi:hypothetical protein
MDSMVVDIGYYGSKSTHLLGEVDLNEIDPVVAAKFKFQGLKTRHPYPQYTAIDANEDWFDANYNSLQASWNLRLRSGGLFSVNYTWSHALTNSSSETTIAQNLFNLRSEYGPTPLDRRHLLTADFIYELPWLRGQSGVVAHVLGGWELSSIITAASGVPATVTGGTNLGLSLSDTVNAILRPDATGDPNVDAPHTVQKWFNTSAFRANKTGPGTASRGSVVGPGLIRLDFAAFKNIRASERLTVQFRTEAFNVLNHTNFTNLNTTFGSPKFGTVTGARDPRIMQLAVKVVF